MLHFPPNAVSALAIGRVVCQVDLLNLVRRYQAVYAAGWTIRRVKTARQTASRPGFNSRDFKG